MNAKKVVLVVAVAAGAAWAVKRLKERRDQAWYWSPEWQAGEREADEELARGEGVVFTDPADMFGAVDRADV